MTLELTSTFGEEQNTVEDNLCLLCQAEDNGGMPAGYDLGVDTELTDDGYSIKSWDNWWKGQGYDSGYDEPGKLDFDWGGLVSAISPFALSLIKSMVAQGASPAAATMVVAAQHPAEILKPPKEQMPVWGWVALAAGGVALLGLLGVIAFKK